MALVMLPCELPWWSVVVRKITSIESTNDVEKILEVLQRIHDLCNISLDPEEDETDSTVHDGLRDFIAELSDDERDKFLSVVKIICRFAKNLKNHRPPRGMNFSLQQNTDVYELDVKFVAALLANSFFSTYPKRTNKTHPTLSDFNFTHFFRELKTNSQKAKFRSFLWYFEWLDLHSTDEVLERKIKLSRKVLTGQQWLTIDDWTECKLPLCSFDIKHDGRIENANEKFAQVIFTKSAIGSSALHGDASQESTLILTHPELLILLLYAENLEDNEFLLAENVLQISRIIDPKNKAIIERLAEPRMKTSMICMDAESYGAFASTQYEEDNCLRELNKCLLSFRQNTCAPMSSKLLRILSSQSRCGGRLSPIGESRAASARESIDCFGGMRIRVDSVSTPTSTTSTAETSFFGSQYEEEKANERRRFLALPENHLKRASSSENDRLTVESRRGRFIVLGSSGECLPVKREYCARRTNPPTTTKVAQFFEDSDEDEDDVFYSARNSMASNDENSSSSDDDADLTRSSRPGVDHQRYSNALETPENRFRFAQLLKNALKQEQRDDEDCSINDNEDDGYAVDINVEGSQIHDEKIKIRRGTSTGFILEDEESLDDCLAFQMASRNRHQRGRGGEMQRTSTGNSSTYSFETEVSGYDEIYDELSKWLKEPDSNRKPKLKKFAESLLKRTLSESYLGEQIEEEEDINVDDEHANSNQRRRQKMISNFRSLSLEISRHRSLLAAQLLNQKFSELNSNLKSVATGSWGCGERQQGDTQFKALIQWCAASVANVPGLIYYTCSRESLNKLDTVVRVVRDRKWTVGELLQHTLSTAKNILNNPSGEQNFTLFDRLIGHEKGAW